MSISFYTWRDNVVTCLLGLADLKYQQLAWRGEIASADGSPVEMLSTLVDDFAFESFATDNREHLSPEQGQLCQDLSAAMSSFYREHSEWQGADTNGLAKASWRQIVERAQSLYHALCPTLTDV